MAACVQGGFVAYFPAGFLSLMHSLTLAMHDAWHPVAAGGWHPTGPLANQEQHTNQQGRAPGCYHVCFLWGAMEGGQPREVRTGAIQQCGESVCGLLCLRLLMFLRPAVCMPAWLADMYVPSMVYMLQPCYQDRPAMQNLIPSEPWTAKCGKPMHPMHCYNLHC
jgi:hypothetical protein